MQILEEQNAALQRQRTVLELKATANQSTSSEEIEKPMPSQNLMPPDKEIEVLFRLQNNWEADQPYSYNHYEANPDVERDGHEYVLE